MRMTWEARNDFVWATIGLIGTLFIAVVLILTPRGAGATGLVTFVLFLTSGAATVHFVASGLKALIPAEEVTDQTADAADAEEVGA